MEKGKPINHTGAYIKENKQKYTTHCLLNCSLVELIAIASMCA